MFLMPPPSWISTRATQRRVLTLTFPERPPGALQPIAVLRSPLSSHFLCQVFSPGAKFGCHPLHRQTRVCPTWRPASIRLRARRYFIHHESLGGSHYAPGVLFHVFFFSPRVPSLFFLSFLHRLVGELSTTGVGRPDFTFGQFGVITL